MNRKPISEVLGDVDPNLKVIPGGIRRRHNRNNRAKLNEVSYIKLPVYTPRRMNDNDWNNAGGVRCPRCNQECVQLVAIGLTRRIKMCPDCIKRRRRLLEHKRRLIDIRNGNSRARAGSVTATS